MTSGIAHLPPGDNYGLVRATTWIFAFVWLIMVTTAMRRGFRGSGVHQLALILAG